MSKTFVIQDMPSALQAHKLSQDDYKQILAILGREPNLVELGIFSAMWSEHCSYKSSRIYLKGFPTSAPWVIQGPGENAGVIDIGGGYAAVFKVESHNHPSFIEPYAGAATGVGGIMRDIFTMGARPIASLDSIRFGEIWRDDEVGKKHRSLLNGVVAGIGGYGNCMGVPTIGGETSFEPCYNGNILVNAFCLGIAKTQEIFYAKAQGNGNPVLYVGSKTGRDGLGGAVMSSDSFSQDSKSLRPTVQVGDPFTEKLLLEACLELFAQDLIIGIQDMGAAGLTSSSFEMAGRSGSGMKLYLDRVPMREKAMNAYELMLSESQERMLICAKKGAEAQIKAIFDKWELDCEVIGEVTQSGDMELFWEEEKIAHIPIAPITENAPILHLPTKEPEYICKLRKLNPLESIQHHTAQHSLTDIARILLGSLDICDKEWIYSQYDSSVQTNTIIAAGQGEGSVVRIKENGVALGTAIHAPVRYCYLNPKEGSKIAVARAGRKCATRGIKPLAISDCLNFGNPNNPEVMWQFKESCEGIKEACEVLQTPVVSGNVSLYNQTDSTDIYPTPTIVSVGLAQDPQAIIDSAFTKEGSKIALLGEIGEDFGGSVLEKLAQMGSFARELESNPHNHTNNTQSQIVPQGDAPHIDLSAEKRLWDLLLSGIAKGLILSAKEVGEGGLGIALAKMSILSKLGCAAQIALPKREMLFSQTQSCVVVETSDFAQLQELAKLHSFPCALLGEVLGDSISIQVKIDSALGEQCGSVADFVKGTNAKFANLPQNPQSNHSPTATPRILEEKQGRCEKSAQTQKVDSSTASSNQQAGNPQAIHLSIQEASEIFFQSFTKHLGINA
ncbi:phosphoribosylformylglycinamidine synthase subunit PurL [Helicobacter canis]|uniref:Phosphoribosylformylglycinamidine synthase subunit PurL n=1 Tax=Helicobacter canis NCTC 12740 TaxID=1357399 RepID=V8CG44_9HELI|nr:phosphoribosylformylglycinamidine synthase subunit PurL [Helicobacter canis]ETD25950.1 phosphoribosylformylglycinamidine synthase II [Helicobacter canis NCTC 12740]